ncbi:MAG: hypothetical protein MUF15_23530 [Acidobacteria bacterium]|jgi:hypothetical protein|nr:hypothetical protein [Acidobacteriota bacterium]
MARAFFIKKLPSLLLIFLVVGLAGSVFISCSGSDTDPTDTSDIKKYDRSKATSDQDSEEDKKIDSQQVTKNREILKEVSLQPKAIRTDSTITVKAETTVPLEENQNLAYVYWKNGNPLAETKEAELPPLSCKKHDILFVFAMLYENDELIAKKRSQSYIVLNSAPIIEEVIQPDIKGPGTYKFITKAKDVDNDQLTFSMEMGNEDTGETLIPAIDAQINPTTGEVTCTLDQNLPDAFSFTIAADDGDGGVTKKIVSLRFFKRPVIED